MSKEQPENKSYYLAPDIELMTKEYKNGVKIGESCQISDLKNIYSYFPGFLMGLTGQANQGKAECIHTDIPTPSGFKKMLDIKIGDIVFDENGEQCKVTYTTGIQFGKECYKMTFGDGSVEYCCEDHLWLVHTNNSRQSNRINGPLDPNRKLKLRGTDQSHKRTMPKVISTKEIAGNVMANVSSKLGYRKYRYSVAVSKPIQCEESNLPLHPYLLGVWLGDGDTSNAGLTSADQQILDEINSLGYRTSKRKAKYRYGLLGITPILRSLSLFGNKHIPTKYLFSSYNQRLALLQGLMDTDGFVSEDGYCEISLTKEQLARDVYALICSLGIKCSFLISDAKLYGRKVSDRFRMNFKTLLPIFRLSRKLARQPKKIRPSRNFRSIVSCEKIKSRPVKCIQVDSKSHLYLTGRSFIPTHNTSLKLFIALVKAIIDDKKFCIWSPEMIISIPKKKGQTERSAGHLYNMLIHAYTGENPYKHKGKQMSIDRYMEAFEFVEEHFRIIDTGKDKRSKIVREAIRRECLENEIYEWIIDPWKNVIYDEGNSTKDRVLQLELDEYKELAMETNTVGTFILHPKNMKERELRKSGGLKGAYKVITQHDLLGGSVWDNSLDSIHSYYRQEVHDDPNSPYGSLYCFKQKMQEITNERGACDTIYYEKRENRFYFSGICPIDGSRREPIQGNFFDQKSKSGKARKEPEPVAPPDDYVPF